MTSLILLLGNATQSQPFLYFLQKTLFEGTSDIAWAGEKKSAKGGRTILGFIFNLFIADIIMTF